jgi:glycosyltransferase involved in cell wall biosynthesis
LVYEDGLSIGRYLMDSVHIDLTEIVRHPLRSGIQRVEREAIRHWDGPKPVPCIVDDYGRLLRLHPAVLDVLNDDNDGSPAARASKQSRLAAFVREGVPLATEQVGRLLNLELFYDPTRADAHLQMAASGVRVMYYLYDFLPFLRPELFPPGTTRKCMHFLRGIRSAGDRVAFLSQHTRDDYARRIARRSAPQNGWPVLDPGADGLALERQSFRPERRRFVSIGTVEARKNTDAMLDAFILLWKRGVAAELTIAGRIAPDALRVRDLAARHGPNFRLLEEPADDELRHVLRQARAVIMPSEAEGFGLPPYEALHAGIAAIASAHLPSATIMTSGALLLDRMDATSIAGAIETMLVDDVAARLWAGASALKLPSWQDFGRELSAWARTA